MTSQTWKQRRRFLAVLLCLFSFGATAVSLTPARALAAPAVKKHPSHQPGTFLHLATGVRPAAGALGCAGTSCNDRSAYATGCAGQSWDSWWVVTSNPIIHSGRTVGVVQLWWSETCQTNWTRLVPFIPYTRRSVLLVLQDCTPINQCSCSLVRENCHDMGNTVTLGASLITLQLYAPVANACAEATFRSATAVYGPTLTGQFHAPNAPSQCYTDYQISA